MQAVLAAGSGTTTARLVAVAVAAFLVAAAFALWWDLARRR